MGNQYFKINRNSDKLVKITKCISDKVGINFNYKYFFIDQQFLRKIKIQNIQNNISNEHKKILDFLLNEKNATLIKSSEYEYNNNYTTNTTTCSYTTTTSTTTSTLTSNTTSLTSTITNIKLKMHWWEKIFT